MPVRDENCGHGIRAKFSAGKLCHDCRAGLVVSCVNQCHGIFADGNDPDRDYAILHDTDAIYLYAIICRLPAEQCTRNRNSDHDPGAARELLAHDARRRERVFDAMLEPQPARAHVERGQLVGAVADDGHAERL